MAAPERLSLPPRLAAALLELARHAPDAEICGLISGNGHDARRHFPIPNIAADPSRFFELDPRRQIDALREMRGCGETLVAIYHSHPRGPAVPSKLDIERHAYPEAACVVLVPDPPAVKAFRIANGSAEEIPVSR